MSDKLRNSQNTFDAEHEAMIIASEASRWQEPWKYKKDIGGVIDAVNYYESAKKNSTKDPTEALNAVYEALDGTVHFLINGSDSKALDKIEEVADKVGHRLSQIKNYDLVKKQIADLRKKSPKDLSQSVLALVYSNDMSRTAIFEITPK